MGVNMAEGIEKTIEFHFTFKRGIKSLCITKKLIGNRELYGLNIKVLILNQRS